MLCKVLFAGQCFTCKYIGSTYDYKKVHKINTKKQQNVHTFTLQVDVSHFLSQESCVSEFRSCEMKAVSYFPIVPRGNTRKFTSHSQVVTSPKLPCPRRAHSSYFSLFLYGT